MSVVLAYIAAISTQLSVELSPKQTKCIAHAVYHEARGEPIMGQSAVAYVINNRVAHKRYPDTACEVVYQPWQFSHIKQTVPDYDSKAWARAVEIAAYSQVGLIQDETQGATMYVNLNKVKPKWDFSKLALVGSLQGHTFYKEIK